jgi:hypothetical protein
MMKGMAERAAYKMVTSRAAAISEGRGSSGHERRAETPGQLLL